jgi:hypothetical protein
MRFLRYLPLVLLALFLSAPLRADMVLYNVQANLTSFSGTGGLSFLLNTNGTPDFNVTAEVSSLSFTGGSYGIGTGNPAGDVVRSGSTITFGGTASNRTFDIPVWAFGSALNFNLALNRQPGGTTDGWSFSMAAFDDAGANFDAILFDISPAALPAVTEGLAITATVVPEPATWAGLLIATGFVAYRARRRR